MAHYTPSPSLSLADLHRDTAQFINRVTRNILSLAISKETIAQIIDNMPIKCNYIGAETMDLTAHPEIETRLQPSTEAMQSANEICTDTDPMKYNIDTRAAERFQKEVEREPGSIASILLCLEIVSSLVHDITSEVYQNRHEDPEIYEKRNETPGCEERVHGVDCCPKYGRMHLPTYSWGDGLKNSWASIVGYWAESMIFGGPVLFARGPDGTECSAAFIHVPRGGGIVKLTDDQLKSFFSLADREEGQTDTTPTPPLPFTVSSEAGRLSVEKAIAGFIYREDGQLDGKDRYLKSIGKEVRNRCGFTAHRERY